MPKKRIVRKGGGFTLIELLVAIAVIGLLAGIVLAALSGARQKARDARRLSDLKALATALELRSIDIGHYPISPEWVTGCDTPDGGWIPDGDDYAWAGTYLPYMPRDPLESCSGPNERSYSYWSNGEEFKITTQLEAPRPPAESGQTFTFDGASFQVFVDTSPVTVNISSSVQNPTSESPIPLAVSFSRAVVDFTQGAVDVVRGFVSGFSQAFATLYNVLITPTDNDIVVVTIAGGAAHDESGIGNAPAQFTITYDSLAPHVALSPDPLPAAVGGSFSVSVNFTIAVTDFSAGDIAVENGSVSNFSMTAPMDGTNFFFIVTPASAGAVTVRVPSGAAHSAAGNGNVASNELHTTFAP